MEKEREQDDARDPNPQWTAFKAAVTCLQDVGDREHAAELFEYVVRRFPGCRYVEDSKEIAMHLREMLYEDDEWVEVADVEKLSVDQKIDYYVYHLRNLNCYQRSQPGSCNVLSSWSQPKKQKFNAAIKLCAMGEVAIPRLIPLLDF